MDQFELCGFKADQNGAFPVEAYYVFCEKRGIPFPFDWQPKGRRKGLYTIEQAVLKIMELSPEEVEHTEDGSLMFDGVAECLFNFFCGKVCFDEKRCEASLGSYRVGNPFNYGKAWDLFFPREAFFEVWNTDRNGMTLPRWFADLDRSVKDQKLWRDLTENIALVTAMQLPEAAEIADGLTVAAVRKVFDSSPALRDIVAAVAEVQAMPRDGVQKPSAETVEAKIRLKAKAHGWGSTKDGSLSDTQWKGLKSVVFGLDRGGRPTKDDGKPPEGFLGQ